MSDKNKEEFKEYLGRRYEDGKRTTGMFAIGAVALMGIGLHIYSMAYSAESNPLLQRGEYVTQRIETLESTLVNCVPYDTEIKVSGECTKASYERATLLPEHEKIKDDYSSLKIDAQTGVLAIPFGIFGGILGFASIFNYFNMRANKRALNSLKQKGTTSN